MNKENFSPEDGAYNVQFEEDSASEKTAPLELTDYEKKVVKRLIHHIGVWLGIIELLFILIALAAFLLIVFFLFSLIF